MSSTADATKRNNLVGTTPADQVSSPPSTGQNKATGNDLVNPKGDANQGGVKQVAASHPDFNTLDTKKKLVNTDACAGNPMASDL